jgi:6-pyruvoyltetrahydropterin/6-carboxytetrahydropterin synthase
VNELDHHVLLPTRHPAIHVTADDREVTATFEQRRWVFPREDCILLPVANTTAELIAHWLAGRLKEVIQLHPRGSKLESLVVEVEENFGQWAVCETDISA